MEDRKPASTHLAIGIKFHAKCPSPLFDATIYLSLVGRLLYLTHTRSNIGFVVNLSSQYLQAPHESSHLQVVKHLLCYLKGTTCMAIHFAVGAPTQLEGFFDAN
jgi:hypothetical protein